MEYIHVMRKPHHMNVFRVVMSYIIQWNEAKHILSRSRRGNGVLDTLIVVHVVICCYIQQNEAKHGLSQKLKGEWDAQYFDHSPHGYSDSQKCPNVWYILIV